MPARPPVPRVRRLLTGATGARLIGPAWADALSDGRFRDGLRSLDAAGRADHGR